MASNPSTTEGEKKQSMPTGSSINKITPIFEDAEFMSKDMEDARIQRTREYFEQKLNQQIDTLMEAIREKEVRYRALVAKKEFKENLEKRLGALSDRVENNEREKTLVSAAVSVLIDAITNFQSQGPNNSPLHKSGLKPSSPEDEDLE
ncbi:hypothetical protein OPT61_g6706 [Boeremia exigua]|uniref:Uncharacterized protein n=1 Tax=Boeremia exigua TaxID=749465 RepID=A0ACC2I555_9PLEO|nr:hypothetical protein OPT61_g6706 [Boeremia exigua]